MIQLQANIGGYSGKPASVFAALDEDTGILVIAAAVDRVPRREGCVLISNELRADRDSLFQDADLKRAIGAYFTVKGRVAGDGRSACLRFSERAARADPSSAIESDGVDMSGPMYRVAPEASNMQVAALAVCAYAERSGAISDAMDMADELLELLSGQAITI
ncbi:hypothetical protein D9M68_565360 [compost metagenome]